MSGVLAAPVSALHDGGVQLPSFDSFDQVGGIGTALPDPVDAHPADPVFEDWAHPAHDAATSIPATAGSTSSVTSDSPWGCLGIGPHNDGPTAEYRCRAVSFCCLDTSIYLRFLPLGDCAAGFAVPPICP